MSTGDARRRVLWSSRGRAMQKLAERYPEEFQELRDEELAKIGERPAPRRVPAT